MLSFFSKLSKREKYIAYVSIGIIIFLVLDKCVISQVMNRLAALDEEILVLENKLEKSINILQQEDAIFDEYEKYVEVIKKQRSDEEIMVVLLSNIEKMANQASVRLVDMKPTPSEKKEFYTKYTIRIEAEAEISQLINFIYQLEKTDELFRISELRLSPVRTASSVLKIYMLVTQIQVA
jgi:Tfp pilus assembly protein PilO